MLLVAWAAFEKDIQNQHLLCSKSPGCSLRLATETKMGTKSTERMF